MCIIVAVDHIPCTHTVAIWQQCVNAARGKPCSKIRQHGRPILTRKRCYNCGGPRYFARRGGIADRGRGSTTSGMQEFKPDFSDANDSGYHSDVIHEEEEKEDELDLSPRSIQGPGLMQKEETRSHRSPSRKPTWRPNLKHELMKSNSLHSYHRASIDSTISRFEEDHDSALHSRSSSLESTSLPGPTVPILLPPSPTKRKDSTLLHPSPPIEPELPPANEQHLPTVSLVPLTPPLTPPQRPDLQPPKDSTLLHPPPPPPQPTETEMTLRPAYKFPSSLPTSTSPARPTTPPQRPSMPRKNSTLLHPSSPPTEIESETFPFPPHPKGASTPPPAQRVSILHSSLSDNECEAHSDTESAYDSDDHEAEGDTESFQNEASDHHVHEAQEIVLATTALMARPSRIDLLGEPQFRVLQHMQCASATT
ncbi:hypothetical protein BDV95DRAFT_22297 [Massariosphaeria phaeospora]|uniref:Uncharacterized protein n=1 Tax=Massariosphaeria phaeospora TaxID=100035 RepID=A0A7C8MJN4_9PLEO|nr:hypothetical protein BDV95DRAFT_22297 [Massariosphaeria phaeospora]